MKTLKLVSFTALAVCSFNASALNIALTNDDGWDAPGIQAMKAALVAAGHNVVMAGSLTGQSGSSAALNFFEGLEIVKQRGVADEGALELSVALDDGVSGAEPVTAGGIAIAISEQLNGAAPDLVVSGINAGQNLGAAHQISGTVGATIGAMSDLIGGARLPAIGISTDEPCETAEAEDPAACQAEIDAQYERSAAFVVDLVDALDHGWGPLMPEGFGINVNYPPLVEVEGAKVTNQGITATSGGAAISVTWGCYADCVNVPNGTAVPGGITGLVPSDTMERRNADTTLNAAGYITLVPMQADYTAGVSYKPGVAKRFRKSLARTLRKMGY